MINFPLYALREYISIWTEGEYSILCSARNRFVIDYATPDPETTYGQRRVALLAESLPYSLYPLKVRITSMSGIINNKYRQFIDSTGVIVTWKISKFYKIKCYPITHREITKMGSMLFKVQGFTKMFKAERNDYPYVRIVCFKGVNLIYDFIDEKVPDIRRKL